MSKPNKRNAIVGAALEIIAEQGFHGATMAVIAGRAGVAAGTIYRYFPGKEMLIRELYREVKERVTAHIKDGHLVDKPLRDRFIHQGIALVRYFISNPLDFRYMEQYYNSPYGVACRRDWTTGKNGEQSMYRDIFNDGISSQVIKNLPMAILLALAFGPLFAVIRDHVFNFIALDEALIVRVVAASWDCVSCCKGS